VPPHSSQTNGNPVAPMSRPAATASAAIRAADEEGTRVIEDSRRAQAAVTHRPEGRSRVITKTRARSRACARGAFDDSPGGASAASAIMNASIASPWHRARNPVGNGRNRHNVCQRYLGRR
jgi:hypothetical protein